MSQKNGSNYVVLYLMLCMMCVNTNGTMASQIGEVIVPFDADKITRDCKHFNRDTVIVGLELFKKLGLIYEQENGILAISEYSDFVGSETDYAIKKRELRKSAKQQLLASNNAEIETMSPVCLENVSFNVLQEKEIRERDKSLDIGDKNLETDKDFKKEVTMFTSVIENDGSSPSFMSEVREIISYLNEITDSHYRPTIAATQRLIKARLNEGFTIDDFKTVIEKMSAEWLNDPKMREYLRPKTLFGTKFESYLNRPRKMTKTEAFFDKWDNA